MATDTLKGRNRVFPIYNEDGTPFHNLVLRKSVVDSVVMSLGDKITGDVYYENNSLTVTMQEYVEYKTNPDDANEIPVRYMLVNPPTTVREGVVAGNSELKGMTKYSFEFYHPMYQLSNFPFTDVATKTGEEKYLSQNKSFSWIGNPQDYIDKLNKNLQGTVWYVRKSDRFPVEKNDELSEVQQFDNVSVAEAIKRGYEIWGIPYIVSQLPSNDPLYAQGKRFVVEYGLPSNEIYENESARQLNTPYVFQMGQGVGLKNNSRTPRNNKIVTRIAGYGSEENVPYGYPQIVWTGNQDWDYTIDNDPNNPLSYPIYKGIVGGQYVKLIKHPFTRTHLMPSIFAETVNKKVNPNAVGYDPTIEIKDYYDAVATQEYPYVNEINLQAPSYESHEFADIKPELDADRNTGIVSAIPLNNDLTPADHWDDTMDDDGNYLQSYFQITLPQLTFDLYACAAITQEMQINMRSGACIGCTFPVQVDWDDYKRNFYDEDGNFVPDGQQRDLTKYPKSNLGQISVVVQKDNNTFGTLMPNIYQQPKANDLFVFIGISLPISYISNAEERLDDAMKTYMLENNVFYFDYPLKFDEYFLANNTNILEQIRPNSIIHFDYGGVEQQLFVKQITVKYGNAPLPQYDITLTDNIEVVLNQIGQVADDVEKLSSLIAILRQSYSRNVWNELAKKLSKVQDDTAQGFITMLKGLQIGANFVPDILGEGGVFRKENDGMVNLVTDKLYVRVKAYFDTVEIRRFLHTGGNRIASVAGMKCCRVEWLDSSNNVLEQTDANRSLVKKFRCYFRASDGDDEVRNDFQIGDQAYCHVTSVATSSDNPEEKGLNQKHYWRLVIGRNTEGTLTDDGEAYIDLSNYETNTISGVSYAGYQSGSDFPDAQDDIIQLGNVNDSTRRGAIVEYVSGTDAPSYQIYQGLGTPAASGSTTEQKRTAQFSLNGKNYIGLGYNSATGRAYMNVYGDAYIGDRNRSTYIEYKQDDGTQQHAPVLNIKAKINAQSTLGDKNLKGMIDSKGTTYHSWNEWVVDGENLLQVDDLFVPDADTTQSGTTYKANKIYRCSQITPSIAFVETSYTDDTALHAYIGLLLNKTYAAGDDAVAAAAERAVNAAVNDNFTTIDGGLIATSTIFLRNDDTTWSGINGIYDANARGGGISWWSGGAMADMENMTAAQQAAWDALTDQQKAASSDWAKSLDRFDGSGYKASKSIRWTADGKVYLSNIHSASGQAIDDYFFEAFAIGIDGTTRYINPTFSFSDIDIVRRSGAAYTITGTSVLNRNENDARYMSSSKFADLFAVYNGDTDITSNFIANGLPTDVSNISIKAKFSFWSQGDISALGQSSGGGGGGGGGASVLYELHDVLANAGNTGVLDAQAGYVLTCVTNGAGLAWKAAPAAQTYVLPQATSGALGGIKIGFTTDTTNKNYAVALDNDGKAYVNVPWSSGGVQSDWNQSDSTALDYIKNKPSIPSVSASVSGSTLTVTINGTSYSLTDTNTWRPLGTGATDAAAGNHDHDGRYLSSSLVSIELNTTGALSGYGGYIDFHFNGSQDDYTSRIIEDQSGRLNINSVYVTSTGDLTVGGGDLTINEPVSGGAAAIWFQSGGTTKGNLRVKSNGELYFYTGTGAETTLGNVHMGTLQAESVKIEETNEINSYSGMLHLNYRVNTGVTLCYGGGSVGVGTVSPSYKLHVSGDIYATGDVTAASDERAKDVISNVVLDINDIANAPAVKFTWKDKRDELVHVGSIAQYWQKILPESVSDRNDVLGLNYGAASMVGLVSVAKEVVSQCKHSKQQDEQIKELERQLNNANERIVNLKNEVERLKSA